MVSSLERWLWFVVTIAMLTFAIPWFYWGDDTVVVGLPIWLWWHIGWLLLAALFMWVFTRRAWGIGITGGERA